MTESSGRGKARGERGMGMFGKKSEDDDKPAAAGHGTAEPRIATADVQANPALPVKPGAQKDASPALPARKPTIRPEVVRRTRDYSSTGREELSLGGGYSDSKRLVVGRDIALSGSINACEKLVVQGRVEASMTDCSEIEVADSGTFKGEAEIDVAEVNGVFEGTLVARELLLIRSNGRVSGKIRFGRLEVERGGELMGDVQVYTPENGED